MGSALQCFGLYSRFLQLKPVAPVALPYPSCGPAFLSSEHQQLQPLHTSSFVLPSCTASQRPADTPRHAMGLKAPHTEIASCVSITHRAVKMSLNPLYVGCAAGRGNSSQPSGTCFTSLLPQPRGGMLRSGLALPLWHREFFLLTKKRVVLHVVPVLCSTGLFHPAAEPRPLSCLQEAITHTHTPRLPRHRSARRHLAAHGRGRAVRTARGGWSRPSVCTRPRAL